MHTYKAALIGELIGMARATDGNEHLITKSATAVIRKVLYFDDNQLTESLFLCLREEIMEEKRQMVPDCFHCSAPCGKTSAYDLAAIRDHKQFKDRLLTDLTSNTVIPEDLLYKGLIILGMDDIYPELEAFWDAEMKKI